MIRELRHIPRVSAYQKDGESVGAALGNAVKHFVSHEMSRHALACGSRRNRGLAPGG